MDLIKSLSEIFEYADKHNLPITTVLVACVVGVLAWIGKKGGGKALSVMGGVLSAADKMLESMQKRLDTMQAALERSENLNEHYRQKITALQAEKERVEGELSDCFDSCHDCHQKLKELKKES